MTNWIDVIADSALAEGEHIVTDIDGYDVALFKINGELYAIEDVCSHDGAEIASGELDGDEIICPRHGARFCIKTGQVRCAPAYEDIATFPVKVISGRILIQERA